MHEHHANRSAITISIGQNDLNRLTAREEQPQAISGCLSSKLNGTMKVEPSRTLDITPCDRIAQLAQFSDSWFDAQEMHLNESELECLVCRVLHS